MHRNPQGEGTGTEKRHLRVVLAPEPVDLALVGFGEAALDDFGFVYQLVEPASSPSPQRAFGHHFSPMGVSMLSPVTQGLPAQSFQFSILHSARAPLAVTRATRAAKPPAARILLIDEPPTISMKIVLPCVTVPAVTHAMVAQTIISPNVDFRSRVVGACST
ncbi:MAG: hypothetical protein R3C97_09875 [Geminicoccaceae bacterium]